MEEEKEREKEFFLCSKKLFVRNRGRKKCNTNCDDDA